MKYFKGLIGLLGATIITLGPVSQASIVASTVTSSYSVSTEETEQSDTETEEVESVSATNGMINTDDFIINVKFGIDGNYRLGASMPVKLSITNLGEDFDGTIRIITPANTDYGYAPIAYEKEVLLTGGQENTVDMSINDNSGSAYLYLQIDNSKGKTILDETIKMSSKSTENALVGVLSDDYTALNYMDKADIILDNYTGKVQFVEMDADSFPTDYTSLEALSYLIINSFDTSRLTDEQIGAIQKWVSIGGVLILGTGSDYKQTLSGFGADFISLTTQGNATGDLYLNQDTYLEYLNNDSTMDPSEQIISQEFDESAGILDMTVDGANTLTTVTDQKNLVWDKEYKKGHIVVTAFNLGMEPVVSWKQNTLMARFLFKEAANGYSDSRIAKLNYGSYTGYSTSNLRFLRDEIYPHYLVIVILLVIFIVGIILAYLILKKLDRRGLMWVLIPVGAGIFAMAIMIANSDITINDPQTTSMTCIYDNGEENDETTYDTGITILAPSTQKTNVKLSNQLSELKSVGNDSGTLYYDTSRANSKDYSLAIKDGSEGYELNIKNDTTFENSFVNLSYVGEEKVDVHQGLVSDMTRTVSGISGTVTNNTGKDLEAVVVMAYGKMVSVGDLPDGKSASFTDEDNQNWSYADQLYDLNLCEDQDDASKRNKIANAYYMIYNSYMAETFESEYDQNSAFIMGFVDDWQVDYVTNSKIDEVNKAVVLKKGQLSLEDYPDGQFYSLAEYVLVNQDWDMNDGQMYAETADIDIDLSQESFPVYEFIRNADSDAYYGTTADTQIYIYNYDTEDYEEIFTDGLEFKLEDQEDKYLGSNRIIKLRFTCKEAYTDYTPSIYMIGGSN